MNQDIMYHFVSLNYLDFNYIIPKTTEIYPFSKNLRIQNFFPLDASGYVSQASKGTYIFINVLGLLRIGLNKYISCSQSLAGRGKQKIVKLHPEAQ